MTWHRVTPVTEPGQEPALGHQERYAKALADRAEAVTALVKLLTGVLCLSLLLIPVAAVVTLVWWLAAG